jgi:hypothetical protein
MAKSQYESYCQGVPTSLVKEKFGDVNTYAQDAKSILTKG